MGRQFTASVAAAAAIALVGAPVARGGPEAVSVEVTNSAWAFKFRAPGLRETRGVGGARQLLHGTCDGGVDVEVLIDEPSVRPRDVPAWLRAHAEAWSAEPAVTVRDRDAVLDPESTATRVLLERPGVGGAWRLHGYNVAARGVHLFVVHATVAMGDGDASALARVLGGLELGADTGLTLDVYETAKRSGRDPADPYLSYQAGMRYARSDPPRNDLAIRSLEAAFRHAAPDAFEAITRSDGEQMLGYAHLALGHYDAALTAFERRRDLCRTAGIEGEFVAVYDMACVHARAGRRDAAFEELARVIASPTWKDLRDHAQRDPDLTTLRADPRWESSGAAAPLPIDRVGR